jgi:hypothetical protein
VNEGIVVVFVVLFQVGGISIGFGVSLEVEVLWELDGM